MVTFRLTVDQFTQLLTVILADGTPNHLSDLVLLKCTRPRNGIISVPVPPDDARAIVAVVQETSLRDSSMSAVAAVLAQQVGDVPA
jgi:hypothetical protein